MKSVTSTSAQVLLIVAGLASAILCQTHAVPLTDVAGMPADTTASPHAHHAMPVEDGHDHSEDASEDRCCVPRIANTRTPAPLIPHAVLATATVFVPTLILDVLSRQPANHKPPGRHDPLDQTSVLLI